MRARPATVALLLALPVLVLLALWWWLPSNEELAARAEQEATQALGVPVRIGALRWRLLPRPEVEVQDVATEQERPITLRRLRLQPRLLPLLTGRLELRGIELDGGTVVQRSLRALGQETYKNKDGGEDGHAVQLDHLRFSDLTWVSYSGVAVVYAGEAWLDAQGQLREARIWRPGVEPPADLLITRSEAAPADGTLRYRLQARLAGGKADGEATLQQRDDGRLELRGRLSPRGVEIEAALAAFNRRSPVGGRADGETVLLAEADSALALAQSLRTITHFSMRPAMLLRFDLERAVDTLGREHQGQTRLDVLQGRVVTQNSAGNGMAIRFEEIQARAGRYSASGSARLHQRQLHAKATVDVVDGLIGMPMTIDGQLGKLDVTLSKAPAIGAAVGTAVLPGIGTAIGAAIGRVIGGAGSDKDGARAGQ